MHYLKKTAIKYWPAAVVSLATFIIYLASLRNEFVWWDDNFYIYDNPSIRALGAPLFRWAFLDFYYSNWHPLTWMSHALDYALWGLDPLGHHLTSIILHAVNTFLVAIVIMRLLDAAKNRAAEDKESFLNDRTNLIAACVTGLLFGLHPVHVESVAWVSERKDLLCGLFYLLSIMAYVKYVRRGGPMWPLTEGQPQGIAPTRRDPRPGESPEETGQAGMTKPGRQFLSRHYLLSLGFFVLALLSKPMAVSLPMVLLILDWHPFGKIRSKGTALSAFLEKLPFVALSLASSAVTVLAQQAGGALKPIDFAPLPVRLLVSCRSLVVYLWKILLPVDLSPFYPYPKDVSLLSPEYAGSIALVIGITVACILTARKQKFPLAVWGFYVITLLPVLGIVQVGGQAMADRYLYLPGIGPFLVIGLAAAWGWKKAVAGRVAIRSVYAGTVIVIILSLSFLTFRQIDVWQNSISLLSFVIEKEPGQVPFAYYNRGMIYEGMGMLDKAIADYDEAIALNPRYSEAYNSRGIAFNKLGRFGEALADYNSAIASDPGNTKGYVNRGFLYLKVKQIGPAVSDFRKACELGEGFGCAMVQYAEKMH